MLQIKDIKIVREISSFFTNIEVYFKESKQHLNLGKNQSVDFDVQI